MVAPEWVVQQPPSANERGATNRAHGILWAEPPIATVPAASTSASIFSVTISCVSAAVSRPIVEAFTSGLILLAPFGVPILQLLSLLDRLSAASIRGRSNHG